MTLGRTSYKNQRHCQTLFPRRRSTCRLHHTMVKRKAEQDSRCPVQGTHIPSHGRRVESQCSNPLPCGNNHNGNTHPKQRPGVYLVYGRHTKHQQPAKEQHNIAIQENLKRSDYSWQWPNTPEGWKNSYSKQPRKAILQSFYGSHTGIMWTTKIANQLYYWPGMTDGIKNMINTCRPCQPNQGTHQS